jgi:heme A synthase
MSHRLVAWLMALAAVTFGIASALHFDIRITIGSLVIQGEPFRNAAIPEAIIGAVVAAGAIGWISRSQQGAVLALTATVVAILGVFIGLYEVTLGDAVRNTADVVYHVCVLALLLVILYGVSTTFRASRLANSS